MSLNTSKSSNNQARTSLLIEKELEALSKFPKSIQTNLSFDFVSSMASSSIDNPILRPKILKMIETIQTYLDLNNEKLIEQIGKQREHEMIDLAKKSSDLNHRQKLQELLIEAINSNDFRKASFIYSYLGENNNNNFRMNQNEENELISMMSNGHSMEITQNEDENELNRSDFDSSRIKDEPYYDDSSENNETISNGKPNGRSYPSHNNNANNNKNANNNNTSHNNNNNSINNNNNNSSSNNFASNMSNNTEYLEDDDPDSGVNDLFSNVNESIREALSKAKKSNPLSPIRHLICSPGLEAKAQKSRIIILYRGRCNGVCYQNKPWSKELHIHYIINTVNCNDHVSRLVKKQGIQFYNSFVLQNQERVKQLIQMYKMEKV